MACASPTPPPSTGAPNGIAYGPGSLSFGYSVKFTGTWGSVAGTVTYGIPYAPPPPKSAWRNPGPSARTCWTMALEFERRGHVETFAFHGLCAGTTGHPCNAPF